MAAAEQRRLQLEEFLRRKEEQKKKPQRKTVENKPPNRPPKPVEYEEQVKLDDPVVVGADNNLADAAIDKQPVESQPQPQPHPMVPQTPATPAITIPTNTNCESAVSAFKTPKAVQVEDPFFSKTPITKRQLIPTRYPHTHTWLTL